MHQSQLKIFYPKSSLKKKKKISQLSLFQNPLVLTHHHTSYTTTTSHTTNIDLFSQFCYDPTLYLFYTSSMTMIYTIDTQPHSHSRSLPAHMLWSSTLSSSHPLEDDDLKTGDHPHNHRRPHHSWILIFSSQPMTLLVNKQDTSIKYLF